MPTIEAEFEVYCDRCGAGLCNATNVVTDYRGTRANVEPCTACLENERDKGYDEGYDQGVADNEESHEDA